MADDEQPIVTGRRRSRGAEASARSSALERLRALRQGGRRSENAEDRFQIKMEKPIYDTVDEDEYDAIIAKRREEFGDFIDDDDGLGYRDDGEEEDWTRRGLPTSSDESDGDMRPRRRKKVEKKEKEKEKEPRPRKHNSSLTAAAAMIGKQRLSSMFTSSVFNKSRDGDKAKGLSCDSIVDDVIAEFAPDEADREKRRRAQPARSFVPIAGVKSERVSNGGVELSRRLELDRIVANGSGSVHCKEMDKDSEGNKELDFGNCQPQIEQFHDFLENSEVPEEKKTEDSAEVQAEPVVKKEEVFTLNAKIKEDEDPALSAMAGWKAAMTGGAGVTGGSGNVEVKSDSISEGSSDFDLESDGSLPFYMLDAYEEFYGPNMGTVYLFGKVKVGSSYQLEKDAEDSRISPTDFCKKLHDAASELKNELAKKLLDLNVSAFIMAPVKRNYALERSDIPAGENYVLKINYPFRDPPPSADLKGETFCALLGTHSRDFSYNNVTWKSSTSLPTECDRGSVD